MGTPSEVIAGRLAALEKVVGVLALPVGLVAVVLVDGGVRVDHDDTFGSVDEDRGAVGDGEHVMTGADDGRYPEGAGEDGAVGERAAGCGDDAEHRAGVESGGLGRCQVGGHEDASERVGGSGGVAEQVGEDLVADGADVVGPGPEVGVGELGEAGGERVDGDPPGVLGRDGVSGDQLERGADELVVVEEEHVGVEDLGLVLSGGAGDVVSGRAELGPGRFEGGVEPLGLGRRCAGSRVEWFGVGVRERGLGSDADAGRRRGRTTDLRLTRPTPMAVTGSSKFRRTSAAIAASASRAWRPEALTSIWSPVGTPRVDSALTLRPLTAGPSVVRLRTVTSASKRRTVSTKRAAGRACRPCSLCRVSSMLATGAAATPMVRRRGGLDAEQLGLDLSGLSGVGGDLGQRRAGGGEGDGGDEAFDDRGHRRARWGSRRCRRAARGPVLR